MALRAIPDAWPLEARTLRIEYCFGCAGFSYIFRRACRAHARGMTMICPRCQDANLDERTRDGVVVDACPRCRGIWLDRGELEKLISRAATELGELERPRVSEQQVYDREPPSSRRGHHGQPHGKHYRKKGLLESLGDIFD